MTQTETLLLSLLYGKDLYAYQMEQIIERAQMRNWSGIGFSSIYSNLKKLEKKELVSCYLQKEPGSPQRKVYHLVEKGEKVLFTEIERLITQPDLLYPDLHVGMILSELVDDEQYRKYLRRYKERLISKMEKITAEGRIFYEKKPRVAAVYRRIKALYKAEMEWLNLELEG